MGYRNDGDTGMCYFRLLSELVAQRETVQIRVLVFLFLFLSVTNCFLLAKNRMQFPSKKPEPVFGFILRSNRIQIGKKFPTLKFPVAENQDESTLNIK